ncbi:hypothetical protein [Actinomyces sp. Marseille-P3109]|uniref:hypothetical protein n=1 Tax=Actinomyces sp. Marseille-P3109 TaxID=2083009 RepID=UPI000D558C88|nr:hypothetical protein [Actinomyces sp. Marseille-P3109]
MVGFRKKSQNSSSANRAAGRGGSGASQRSRASRTEPASRAGRGRTTAATRRGYKTPEQMDSRCLTLAESASGVLGRSLDQALGRLPDAPGGPGAPGGPNGSSSPAPVGWSDAVGAPNPTMGRGSSPGSVRSAQVGADQVDTVADIAADIEF